jgi:LysM repeat protein
LNPGLNVLGTIDAANTFVNNAQQRGASGTNQMVVMLNPFVNLNSTAVELELKRRQKLKIGVYSCLMATFFLMMGLLIQGCRAEQRSDAGDGKQVQVADASNNAIIQNASGPSVKPQADSDAAATSSAAPTIGPVLEVKPTANVAAAPSGGGSTVAGRYVVRSGDTLSAIAKEHGTTVRSLRTMNGLKNDHLTVGRELRVPSAALVSMAR